MAIDAQQFKQIMSNWASGIAVITTQHEGQAHGFTANSLASVSIDPLLISMSVVKTLYAGQLIQASGMFAINILKQDQAEWGKLFAGFYKERTNRFEDINVTYLQSIPILPDTVGWMLCRVYQTLDVGASTLILGEVVEGELRDGTPPLLYWRRSWGRFVAEQ